jgi:hypothetical protein
VFEGVQKQLEKQTESARKAEMAALDEEEKAAKTEEEKVQAAAHRREIEHRPKAPLAGMMDFNKTTMTDPTFLAYSWTDVLSGLVLNVMLLVSGVGLLHWRPWARRLAVWTAALKLVRLVLVYSFFIIAIVPPYAQKLGKVAIEMLQLTTQQTGGRAAPAFINADFYVRLYTVMYSGLALGIMVFGAIYPALLLWHMTRPRVIAACSGRLKLPKEPNQPW